MMLVHRVSTGAALLLVLGPSIALGLPGAHAPAVSTFDTRGSTVVLAYRENFTDVTFRALSYNANFSSTGGNFSAQFGAHYVQLRDVPGVDVAHGAGAGGVGLFQIPLGDRFDNGVPRVSLPLYAGATPTVAVSGTRNFLSAPLVMGFGVSLAPAQFFTVTPFVEFAPSANLDTYMDSEGVQIDVQVQPDGSFRTTPVDEALADAIDTRFSVHLASRAGLMSTLHLGETWDFNVHGEYITFGSVFGGAQVVQAGAGLAFHWDDVVPAVLPARRRLASESCEDVELRFRACPQYQELTRSRAPLPPPATVPPPAAKPLPPPPAKPAPALPPAPPAPSAPPPAAPAPEPPPAAPAPEPPPAPSTPPPAPSGPSQGAFPLP
jgi:hypothetical protein